MEKVRDLGYLDDREVAASVARDAERRRLGSRRAARTLSSRGISGSDSDEALESLRATDLERARELLARRYPEGLPDDPRERQRALRRLVNRGFPFDVVRRALGFDFDLEG